MIKSNEQLVMPFDTRLMIPEDDIFHTFDELTSLLDYSELCSLSSNIGRNPDFNPIELFLIIAFARVLNILSSRSIHEACKTDIRFLYLLQGKRAPSHNTINRFQRKLEGVIESLFSQLNMLLMNLGEVDYDQLFIDGTKIEANANKYSFVWFKVCQRNFSNLELKMTSLFREIHSVHPTLKLPSETFDILYLDSVLIFLHERCIYEKVVFVHGKGRRKHPLQKWIEQLVDQREKWLMYQDYFQTFKGRKSFSKTDRDATFMRMKEDHMKNAQLKPGYNVQIAVTGEYIIGIDISSERSDQLTLIPFLDRLKELYPQTFKNIVADAGYESEENYTYLDKEGYGCFIKPSNHEQLKKRSFKKKIGRRENMTYDPESDSYICHIGRKLTFRNTTVRKSKNGFEVQVKNYECESCQECPVRSQCTKAKPENNKKIQVSEQFIAYREQSSKNIKSEEGVVLRMNRSIQVEGAFGVIKQDYGFRRFHNKGTENVRIEFLLLAFAYNIKKYHNKRQSDRLGVSLFKKQAS